MNCELPYVTARANAKSTLLGRGVIDKFNTILDYSLFTKEANKFWQYAKDNYLPNLPLKERLLTSEDNKVIFNEDAFMRIDAAKGVVYPANETYRNSFNEFETYLDKNLPVTISINLDEESFSVDVKANNKKVGFIRGEVDGTYLTIETTELEPKKGYGTESYKQLGNWANKNGLILRSDKVNRMNEGSTALWEKLVREDRAIKVGSAYQFKSETSSLTESQSILQTEINKQKEDLFYQLPTDDVRYKLKAVAILLSDKAKNLEKNLKKNKQHIGDNWNKIQSDLQIPKEQLELINQVYDKLVLYDEGVLMEPSFDEIALHLGLDYSFVVRTGITYREKMEYDSDGSLSFVSWETVERWVFDEGIYEPYSEEFNNEITRRLRGNPTQDYANLTVPGGVNYTENEISTPQIVPSIKGHAQFSTAEGIGWQRSGDKIQYGESDIDNLLEIMKNSGVLDINCI